MRTQAKEFYDRETQPVEYFNYWHDFAAKHLYGIEINDEIARVAKMNMIVHDDGHTNVISFDALDSIDKMHTHNPGFAKNKFQLILTIIWSRDLRIQNIYTDSQFYLAA